jgi:hypothetical protein|tara:strand:- start:5486 stop:6028 length:543 start_codon:yes stop_codon:yes gene_type:complete
MFSKFIHNSDTIETDYIIKKEPVIDIDIQNTIVNDMKNDSDDSESITIDKNEEAILTHTSEFLYIKTRENIKKRLNKTIEFDIADTIRWRFIWRKTGDIMEGLSLVTSLISTVLSFSAGAFNVSNLAFAAGCSGSISLALMRATSYALKESKEREEQLNILLDKAKIKQVPSLIYDTDNA